jgi:hypothetical protein
MASKKSIWFHLGHALERARHAAPSSGASLKGLTERSEKRTQPSSERHDPEVPALPSGDELMAAGLAMAVDRALAAWTGRSRPGFTGLLRAGAAGAGAALLVELVRPLLSAGGDLPVLDRSTADRMLAGVGHGLVYGSVIEPRVPGPTVVKGALFGSVEYAADPLGGLSGLLGRHAPHRRLPVVGGVLDELDAHERAYLEHVVFGIALAVLYGSRPASNGMRPEDDE